MEMPALAETIPETGPNITVAIPRLSSPVVGGQLVVLTIALVAGRRQS